MRCRKGIRVKQVLLLAVLVLLGFSFILPVAGYARGPWYHGGYYHYGYRGWHHPRVFFGTTFIIPWYAPVVSPVYVARPVACTTSPRNEAYAYPDPEFIAKYKKNKDTAEEWVTVPGQWVGGTWVPSHKVQVPKNPQ